VSLNILPCSAALPPPEHPQEVQQDMATAERSIREILFANKRRYDPQQTIMLGPDFITGNDGCCDLRCIVPESGIFKGRQVIQVWTLKLSVSSSMPSTRRWGLDRRAENQGANAAGRGSA
jgi:hypothetical protein